MSFSLYLYPCRVNNVLNKKNVEISSQNRVISRQDRNQLLLRLSELSAAEQDNILEAGLDTTKIDGGAGFPLAAPVTKTFYVPYMGMISGLQSSLSNVFDTSFTERLQFRVKMANQAVLGASPPSTVNSYAIFGFTILKEEDMRSLHLSNYSAQPLIMLNSTSFEENKGTIAAGQSETTVDISCNGVVRKMLLRVNLSDKSDSKNEVIDEIVLSGSGRELVRYKGDELRLLGNGNWHHQSSQIGTTGASASVYDNIYILDFTGMSAAHLCVGKNKTHSEFHSRQGFAGVQFGSVVPRDCRYVLTQPQLRVVCTNLHLSAPSVKVTLASSVAAGKTATVHVMHETLELISILGRCVLTQPQLRVLCTNLHLSATVVSSKAFLLNKASRIPLLFFVFRLRVPLLSLRFSLLYLFHLS